MSAKKRRFEKFSRETDSESSSDDDTTTLPTKQLSSEELNRNEFFGPVLPPHFRPPASANGNREASWIGPALPPHLQKAESPSVNVATNEPLHLQKELCKPEMSLYKSESESEAVGHVLSLHLQTPQRKSTNEERVIGPILPPHLQKSRSVHEIQKPAAIGPVLPPNLQNSQNEIENDQPAVIGPVLPPHLQNSQNEIENDQPAAIGPVLPPHLQNSQNEVEIGEPESIGPVLPPHLQKSQNKIEIHESASIGPALPPHLITKLQENENKEPLRIGPTLPPHMQLTPSSSSNSKRQVIGPCLPDSSVPAEDSGSEEETFGPDPRLMHIGDVDMDAEVARRAEKARRKMLGLDDVKLERETWMLELPPEKAANLGLGARQFRAKVAPDLGDRSVWTDTPSDAAVKVGKPAKVDHESIIKKQRIDERDREMEKLAKKAAKKAKREESLIDIHTKKQQKEAKEEAMTKEGQPQMRRMFNREEDMQIHRFDEAQKRAILKKAQLLDDRFSRGESKFL